MSRMFWFSLQRAMKVWQGSQGPDLDVNYEPVEKESAWNYGVRLGRHSWERRHLAGKKLGDEYKAGAVALDLNSPSDISGDPLPAFGVLPPVSRGLQGADFSGAQIYMALDAVWNYGLRLGRHRWERRRFAGKRLTSIAQLCIGAAFAILAIGCGARSDQQAVRKAPPPPPADPWVLKCNDPFAKEPALLWNGCVGVRIGRDGTFVGSRFNVYSYEKGGEEKIQPLPPLRSVRWKLGNTFLSPETGTDYLQTLDMRTGILHTEWKNGKIKVSVETCIQPTYSIVAQNWTFENVSEPLVVTVEKSRNSKLLATPKRTLIINKTGDFDVYCDLFISKSSRESIIDPYEDQSLRVEPDRNGSIETSFSWGDSAYRFTSSSHGGDPFEDSRKEWTKRWKTDIVLDGPVEDQQAIHSFLFYLRSGMGTSDLPISPFGLSDANYNGHVFWDADIWVFPALAFVDSDKARTIADYRLKTFALRMKNGLAGGTSALPATSKGAGGKPTSGKAGGRLSAGKVPALPAMSKGAGGKAKSEQVYPNPVFPWESSVTGAEVAPQAMQNEIHINGDVAWMLDQAASLGLADPKKAKQVRQAVAAYYEKRAVKTQTSNGIVYELKNVVSPDENHTGDNDLYTNLLAEWTQGNPKVIYKRPRDKESYLTYDNDPVRSYKQAAAVLSIFPLQKVEGDEARKMMERFAGKVIKNGPAMSHSVHATIWARLGESEKAYEEWRRSWQRYTKHPLMLFSEKSTKDTTYFTTGAAGCLQTVIYGFLGFRIDYQKENMAAWSIPLNDKWLSIRPRLPAAWKSVTFKNFVIKGKRYNLIIDAKSAKVNQGEP